jgi:hypothetical protein
MLNLGLKRLMYRISLMGCNGKAADKNEDKQLGKPIVVT